MTYLFKQKEKVAARNQRDYITLHIDLHVIFQYVLHASNYKSEEVRTSFFGTGKTAWPFIFRSQQHFVFVQNRNIPSVCRLDGRPRYNTIESHAEGFDQIDRLAPFYSRPIWLNLEVASHSRN